MRKLLPTSILVILVFFGIASAQTPDGETPANEGVCDDLMYATPGLYGLCVAFCEAQDCEPEFGAADPFADCKPSNRKLLEVYNKKKGPSDPPMPCFAESGCPCWSFEDLWGLRYRSHDSNYHFGWLNMEDGFESNYDSWSIGRFDGDAGDWVYLTWVWTLERYGGDHVCGLIDQCENEDCLNISRLLSITYWEHAICEAQLYQSGIDRGIYFYDWSELPDY